MEGGERGRGGVKFWTSGKSGQLIDHKRVHLQYLLYQNSNIKC